MSSSTGVALAKKVIYVLEKQSLKGCFSKTWKGMENGDGDEVGSLIDDLIQQAKEVLINNKSK